MKKQFLHHCCALLVSTFFLFNACSTPEPEPEPSGSWSEADQQSHDLVINVQDQIGENLDDWFQTMDSLDAIQEAYKAFINSENVSSATINSQGIAVQYTNGMRGGLFLRPKDDKGEVGKSLLNDTPDEIGDGLKSLVNRKKMILINPHYFERSYYTDQIYSITSTKLGKVDMELSTFYKNQEATVDRFTELSGYGIIQIYSHGWAWPKEQNITDVYLLTGETANAATSAKYWDELKNGNIPVMKVAGPNKYLVAPRFIMEHNDFSQDTVLFFGGFCYSFLGDWPDLIDGFADGAYLGYDWSVYTFRNANWSVNSIAMLCDTSLTSPMTLEGWMQNTDVEKSYWNEKDSRNVHIHYAGDGNLKLWDDVSVSLVPLSPDGVPVSGPGKVGEAYPFRCSAVTNISPLEYVWDIGDGSSPATTQSNEVNITWSEDGNFELSVQVKNKTNGSIIGSAKANVTIGEDNESVIEFVTSCTKSGCWFTAPIQYSPPGGLDDGISVNSVEIAWNGLSFSGIREENNLGNYKKSTISGTLSSDGQKISFAGRTEYEWVVGEQVLAKSDFSLVVTDYPFSGMFGSNGYNDPYAIYGSNYPHNGIDVQQYVTSFEGYTMNNDVVYTVTGVNWDNVSMLCIMFVKEEASVVSQSPAVQEFRYGNK